MNLAHSAIAATQSALVSLVYSTAPTADLYGMFIIFRRSAALSGPMEDDRRCERERRRVRDLDLDLDLRLDLEPVNNCARVLRGVR